MNLLVLILGLVVTILFVSSNAYAINYALPNNGAVLTVQSNSEGKIQKLSIPSNKLLFQITPHFASDGKTVKTMNIKLRQDMLNVYKTIAFPTKSTNVVIVYPGFTEAAYSSHGFYDYYNKKCDTSCLTVQLPSNVNGTYSSSIAGALVLRLLNYSYIYDTDIAKNPDILKKYSKVIILHNEYVTKKEFDAITSHPNVVYLYPNSLYAQVKYNDTKNTIALVKGHGYPTSDIQNGFGWKYDNSKYEYNVKCDNWSFSKTNNGEMLNCYPEYRMLYDLSLLQAIKN